MPQKKVYLTQEGISKLEAELNLLRNERRQDVADRIQRAKELGGTVNNAEYDDAKNEQSFVEGRILTLEHLINNAVIISDKGHSGVVELGSKVTVINQAGEMEHYLIVGSAEASPSEGKISNESPIGHAIIGKKVGDKVEVEIPAGKIKLTLVEVS